MSKKICMTVTDTCPSVRGYGANGCGNDQMTTQGKSCYWEWALPYARVGDNGARFLRVTPDEDTPMLPVQVRNFDTRCA